jgi:wyosine [tRNA(Phe)-imidazoG37] synthetase (radical SAM superfamily)
MSRIFGPVPSRRLGRSLGVDVVPYKTCTFNCVYCECGETTNLTCSRSEFYPLSEILDELSDTLADLREKPEVITLSGAGEPTLYSRLGELIEESRRLSDLPIAVITNSSLLFIPEVREDLGMADIVLPSLDAVFEEPFERINRPHPSCTLARLLDGLGTFLEEYEGKVLLEILLVEGYNSGADDIEALSKFLGRYEVDSIQLNTAARPGTAREIGPMDRRRLEEIRGQFGRSCEIIAPSPARTSRKTFETSERILSMIERRPCTAEDIHTALGIPLQGVVKILGVMLEGDNIVSENHEGNVFYTARERGLR